LNNAPPHNKGSAFSREGMKVSNKNWITTNRTNSADGEADPFIRGHSCTPWSFLT
jgi:hypothetical protein